MAQKHVTISGGMPRPNSVNITQGQDIVFKNNDGEAYTIDFPDKGKTISDDAFPLNLPANGESTLHVKKGAASQKYGYIIKDSSGGQVWPRVSTGPGNKPPQVIVD